MMQMRPSSSRRKRQEQDKRKERHEGCCCDRCYHEEETTDKEELDDDNNDENSTTTSSSLWSSLLLLPRTRCVKFKNNNASRVLFVVSALILTFTLLQMDAVHVSKYYIYYRDTQPPSSPSSSSSAASSTNDNNNVVLLHRVLYSPPIGIDTIGIDNGHYSKTNKSNMSMLAMTSNLKERIDGSNSSIIYEDKLFNRYDIPTWWKEKARLPCPHKFISKNRWSGKSKNNTITVYAPTMSDRTGSIMIRMIKTLAYAEMHNMKYGGNIPRIQDRNWPRKRQIHEQLINVTGLQHILKFVLPTEQIQRRQTQQNKNSVMNNATNTTNAINTTTTATTSASLSLSELNELYKNDYEFNVDWNCVKNVPLSIKFIKYLQKQKNHHQQQQQPDTPGLVTRIIEQATAETQKAATAPKTISKVEDSAVVALASHKNPNSDESNNNDDEAMMAMPILQQPQAAGERLSVQSNLTTITMRGLGGDPNNEYDNIINNTATTTEQNRRQRRSVVVHVRRGDAQPCTTQFFTVRYRPNSYYLKAIKKYATNDDDVTILSQSDSFESFYDFTKAGYNVILDGSIEDAWFMMMNADILIITPRSYFGIIPGILNSKGIVINNMKQNNFISVGQQINNDSIRAIDKLKKQYCKQYLELNPQHKSNQTYW